MDKILLSATSNVSKISFFFELVIFFYLLAFRINIYLPIQLFWFSLICLVSIQVYYVLFSSKCTNLSWILPTLFIIVWLLKTIFVPVGVPFFGSDAYLEQAASQEISNFGWINLSPWGENISQWADSTNYPILHSLSISFTTPIAFPFVEWARWSMPLISLISLSFIYLIGLEIYSSKKIALLGSIGFGFTYMYQMFHSLYIREALSYVFFLATIVSIIKTRNNKYENQNSFFRFTTMIFIVATIFTHHLTSLLLLVFSLLLFLTDIISTKMITHNAIIKIKKSEQINSTISIFLIVALLTYWVYIRKSPLNIIHSLLVDAMSGNQATTFALPSTFHYSILFLIQFSTTVFIGAIAIFGLFLGGKKSSLHLTFVAWGSLLGIASLIFAIAGVPGTSSIASRFELFGYAFLIPAASFSLINITNKRNVLSIPFGLVIILYCLNNVYRIPLYLYTNVQPDFLHNEFRLVPLPEEYDLFKKINPSANLASDHILNRWIKTLSGAKSDNWFGNSSNELPKTFNFDFLIIGERELFLLQNNFYDTTLEKIGMSKIYSSGSVSAYIPKLEINEPFTINNLISDQNQNNPLFISNIKPLAFLIIEIFLFLCSSAFVVQIIGFHESKFLPLGITLMFIGIFIVYLITNLLGWVSPGLTIISFLFITFLLGIKTVFTYRENFYLLVDIFLICTFMFSYGVLADTFTYHRSENNYTEFYVDEIIPCNGEICVTLHITNNEGSLLNYKIDKFNEIIPVKPRESRESTKSLPTGSTNEIIINLQKPPYINNCDSLILIFDNNLNPSMNNQAN
jgi:hypothetical protein